LRLESLDEGLPRPGIPWRHTMREIFRSPPERQGGEASDASPSDVAGSDFVMERFGSLSDADRSFDIEYWQRQGDAAIFSAAWELVELYCRDRGGRPDELRLQR